MRHGEQLRQSKSCALTFLSLWAGAFQVYWIARQNCRHTRQFFSFSSPLGVLEHSSFGIYRFKADHFLSMHCVPCVLCPRLRVLRVNSILTWLTWKHFRPKDLLWLAHDLFPSAKIWDFGNVRSNNWHDFTSFNDSTKARPEGLVMTWRSSEIKKRPRWPRSRAPAQRQNSRRYFFFSLGCEQRHWDMLQRSSKSVWQVTRDMLQRSIKSVWQVTRDMLQGSIKSVWHVTAYPLPHHPPTPPPHLVPPKKHNILRAQVLTNGQYF